MNSQDFEQFRMKADAARANVHGAWYLLPVGYVFAAVVAFMVLAESPQATSGIQAEQSSEPTAALSSSPAGDGDGAFTNAELAAHADAPQDGVQAP
jgi:hypothetical protein